MVIDFHTHTFPDSIAERTVAGLAACGGLPPYTDGKKSSLLASMKKSGVHISVTLPVATHTKQEHTINTLSAQWNGKDNLYYAGAIHPDCENVCDTLDFIKENGLFGIKIHPDYQGAHLDDPRYIRILCEAAKRDLYVVTHAGIDVAFRDHVHCTPEMILRVLRQLDGALDHKLILAHMGSYEMPDTVLEQLCGLPVYMDTAAVLDLYPEKCVSIIRRHGADKILFATDSPWKDQGAYIRLLRSLPLHTEEKESILHANAEKILCISG